MVGKADVEGTDVEVVAYRRGNDVSVTLNKAGVCIFRLVVKDVAGEVPDNALMSLNAFGVDLIVPAWAKVEEMQEIINQQSRIRKH